MDLKNNLFRYATSELSQDAVLCWLVSYALEGAKPDRVLQTCAKELLELFVPELKGKTFTLTNVERQVMHMDVLLTAATNKEIYKIVIEDKTYTGEHSGQLTRYLDQLRETYPDCIPRGVYYKTWFQSDLSAVENAGYQIISRAQMLEFLAPYVKKTNNQILLDYYEFWNDYQQASLQYQRLPLAQWHWQQIYGFYDALQASDFSSTRNAWMGYGYVANPAGGFYGLWVGGNDDCLTLCGVRCQLYLQIEAKWSDAVQRYEFPIALKLALKPDNGQSGTPKDIRDAVVYDENWHYRLNAFHFKKPRRLSAGQHMTIGEYDASSCENAEQLENMLSAAFEDYQKLFKFLKK